MLEQLEVELSSKQRLLREIEELTDRRPQLRLERLDRQLKGRRLQEVAVEVLRQRAGVDAIIHYREWFGWLRAEGYEVSGRDPLNTFLTSVGRAHGVERVGQRTGLYRLAPSAERSAKDR
jgi:RecB family endonuclease NucS